jgi:hypothetical protein
MRGKINAHKLLVGKSEEKRPPGNIRLDETGRIILNWILKEHGWGIWTGFI